MAKYTNFKIWFYDDSLSALGSTTNVISARYKCGMDTIGEGEFTIPLVDTPTRQYIAKYNIAVMTVEIDGNLACFGEIVIDRGDEVITPGGLDLYRVTGLGRLSKLQRDRFNYDIISDGAQGATSSATTDILNLSQYTWTVNTTDFTSPYVSPSAYLVTANDTLLDGLVQSLNQNNHHVVDQPGGSASGGTAEVPLNQVYLKYDMDALSSTVPGGFGGWHFKLNADPTVKEEAPILSIDIIEEEKEVVTKGIILGGGLGAGQFTIADASGTRTAPSGYSYDFTNSTITNTTLEAVSNQPRITKIANLSNIKPEDPDDATSTQSAAEKLVDAGQLWMEERVGGYDTYYRITSPAPYDTFVSNDAFIPWPAYITGTRLEFPKNSPFNAAGAEVTTSLHDIDEITHMLEVEYTITNTGDSAGILMGSYLLGPAPRQERTAAEMIADSIKTINRRLDHASAGIGGSTVPDATNYAPTNVSYVTVANTAELPFERALTGGTGISLVDGGANSTLTINAEVETGDLHNQVHDIVGADHTVTGSQWDVVGLTATNTIGLLTPVSNSTPATEALLKSDSGGGLRLQNITTDGGATFNEDGGNSNFRIESQNKPDFFFVDADQDILLIGDTTLDTRFPTDTWLQLIDGNIGVTADGSNAIFSALVYGAPTWKTSIQARSAGGTRASPSASAADDTFSRWGGGGYTGSAFAAENTAYIEARASQAWTSTNNGSDLRFFTTPDDSTTIAQRMTLTNDGEIHMIDSAVAHGITNLAPTDVFGVLGIRDSSAGGFEVAGYRDADGTAGEALTLIGRLGEAANTVKTTSAIGVIHCISQIKSGTGAAAVGSDGNLFTIRNHTSTAWIVDAEGDTHRDGSDNTFDSWDDAQLARAFDRTMSPGSVIDSQFDDMVQYGRDDLIAAGILHEGGFYNESRLLRLAIGAVWQGYTREKTLERRIDALERLLDANTGTA